MISNELKRHDGYVKHLTYIPLTYNDEVMKMTRGQWYKNFQMYKTKVPFGGNIKSWKIQNFISTTVTVIRFQTLFLEVGSRDLTWKPDLRWPEEKPFRKGSEQLSEHYGKNGGTALSTKKPSGFLSIAAAPPPLARRRFVMCTYKKCSLQVTVKQDSRK